MPQDDEILYYFFIIVIIIIIIIINIIIIIILSRNKLITLHHRSFLIGALTSQPAIHFSSVHSSAQQSNLQNNSPTMVIDCTDWRINSPFVGSMQH